MSTSTISKVIEMQFEDWPSALTTPVPACKFVLLALAHMAGGGDGYEIAHATIESVSQFTLMSHRSVQNAIADLCVTGLIIREKSDIYSINLKRIDQHIAPAPNVTHIPNALLDDLISVCTASEWKVASLILRKTAGDGCQSARISLSDIEDATGLARPTVVDAINGLMTRGFVSREQEGNGFRYSVIPVSPERTK